MFGTGVLPLTGASSVGKRVLWYHTGMKPKTMLYAALGYTTFKVGKLFAKRRVRSALSDRSKRKADRKTR
jgi:hypothetical protein